MLTKKWRFFAIFRFVLFCSVSWKRLTYNFARDTIHAQQKSSTTEYDEFEMPSACMSTHKPLDGHPWVCYMPIGNEKDLPICLRQTESTRQCGFALAAQYAEKVRVA